MTQADTTQPALNECGLNPESSFFKQLQGLLRPGIEVKKESPVFLPFPYPSVAPILDLQHVIDTHTSKTVDSERLFSPSPKVPESTIDPSQVQIYKPSGKWKWMLGHDIVDVKSTFVAGELNSYTPL